MKYLSVIIFATLMTWTWVVIHSDPLISLETHAGIQSKLGTLIEETIRTKRPKASSISIDGVWTEVVENSKGKKILAHFSYRFKEPMDSAGGLTESILKGDGLLEKQNDDESGMERWSLSEVKTTGDSLIFHEAIMITTGDSSAKSDESAVPARNTEPVPSH